MAWDDGARKLAEVMQRSSQGAIGRGSAEHRPDDGAQMQVCDRERAGVTGDAYEYISNRRWWQCGTVRGVSSSAPRALRQTMPHPTATQYRLDGACQPGQQMLTGPTRLPFETRLDSLLPIQIQPPRNIDLAHDPSVPPSIMPQLDLRGSTTITPGRLQQPTAGASSDPSSETRAAHKATAHQRQRPLLRRDPRLHCPSPSRCRLRNRCCGRHGRQQWPGQASAKVYFSQAPTEKAEERRGGGG